MFTIKYVMILFHLGALLLVLIVIIVWYITRWHDFRSRSADVTAITYHSHELCHGDAPCRPVLKFELARPLRPLKNPHFRLVNFSQSDKSAESAMLLRALQSLPLSGRLSSDGLTVESNTSPAGLTFRRLTTTGEGQIVFGPA